ncbi:MAG TPA: ArsA family ATPase [Acidimicrobiales bacterium]|jgi:anion-transporting  ArsA/GET3 family ATPase|nr:ArsA family ATPase [Acidimicrobiales bacterium]
MSPRKATTPESAEPTEAATGEDVVPDAQPTTLDELVRSSTILITCGSGGVGKTTTAAVLAMEAAKVGRRAVVVTIDPAKRLADALGLSGSIDNTPRQIPGDWAGELWAVMLDTKSTFDELVQRYSTEPEQAERILGNRFYRNISGALSGTQEYMAMEKLHELHANSSFDLVVVDTPPTRHALDFLDAPRRLTRFLDHRLYRTLMAPTRGMMRAVNVAAQAFLRTLSKVVGGEVLDDALAFFSAFQGMEEGFRARANEVLELLTDPSTSYVLVASPKRDTVEEAQFFADRLREAGLPVRALIVNRMHPKFTDAPPGAVRALADGHAGSDLGDLYRNLADFALVAEREEQHLVGLSESIGSSAVVRVPFLSSDVHDLVGLAELAGHLFVEPA